MEKIKAWILDHKAMSAGVAIAVVLLGYLWLTSRKAPVQQTGASSNDALSAYYGASAAAQQAGAATNQSTNELAASTNQTNAAKDVALAQVQGALASQTLQYNAVAYQDWLHEKTTASTNGQEYFLGTNAGGQPILTNGGAGGNELYINPVTGETAHGQTAGSWSEILNGTRFVAATWNGAGTAPSPVAGGVTGVAGQPGITTPLPYYTTLPPAPFVAPFAAPTIH